MRRSLISLALALAGCASAQTPPPPQPTPIWIADVIAQLATISAEPAIVWADGDYAVRAACHAYLNQSAARSSELSAVSTGIGMGGSAAAGFLAGAGNFPGAAAAGTLSSLAQALLGLYQNAGTIPYTAATTTLIENALNTYESAVTAPPASVGEAMSWVDDLWWYCTPAGYAELVLRAATNATFTASGPVTLARLSPRVREPHREAAPRALGPNEKALLEDLNQAPPALLGRPRVLVNGR